MTDAALQNLVHLGNIALALLIVLILAGGEYMLDRQDAEITQQYRAGNFRMATGYYEYQQFLEGEERL